MAAKHHECSFCVSDCPASDGSETIFSLGVLPQGYPIRPPADRSQQKGSSILWSREMALKICKTCLLVQTKHKVPEHKLPDENLYPSKTNKLTSEHDRQLSEIIPKLLRLDPGSLILEIGCSDGSLSELFVEKGFRVIGVDPALHPVRYSFQVIQGFFDGKVVARLKQEDNLPDCIIANYVIELVPELRKFFGGLKDLMKENSYIVLEVPYFGDFVNSLRVDGFAHLRCNWFTVTSLVHICQHSNIQVLEIHHDKQYRGGTLRLIGQKKDRIVERNMEIDAWIRREKAQFTTQAFGSFRRKLCNIKTTIRGEIDKLVQQNIVIHGYGAGHKASTLLNWLELSQNEIRTLADVDPNKHNKVVPQANIPISSVEDLFAAVKGKGIAVLNLAIDHTREVEKLLRSRLQAGSYIIHPLPEFRVITV